MRNQCGRITSSAYRTNQRHLGNFFFDLIKRKKFYFYENVFSSICFFLLFFWRKINNDAAKKGTMRRFELFWAIFYFNVLLFAAFFLFDWCESWGVQAMGIFCWVCDKLSWLRFYFIFVRVKMFVVWCFCFGFFFSVFVFFDGNIVLTGKVKRVLKCRKFSTKISILFCTA